MRLVTLLVLQFSSLPLALGSANCTVGWSWALNSLGQNPCVIAGALEAPCRDVVSWPFDPLPVDYVYSPPSQDGPDCECSTVLYSLIMACTACQNVNGSTIAPWPNWIINCPLVYVTQYPDAIPFDTAVPHWAYLNVTVSGTWSAVDSEAVANAPESTATPIPTVNGGSSSTSHFVTSTSSSSSSSNTGIIAGGVVGGLAALAILAGFITWLVVHKRRGTLAGQVVNPKYGHTPTLPYFPTSLNGPQMKLYNPNDPSSFPTSEHVTPSMSTKHSETTYPSTLYDPTPRGRYTGAPEV